MWWQNKPIPIPPSLPSLPSTNLSSRPAPKKSNIVNSRQLLLESIRNYSKTEPDFLPTGREHELLKLLQSSLCHDTVLICQGKKFHVHKCIVSQSKKLEKMIDENQQEIFVDYVDPKLMSKILEYMYSGTMRLKVLQECVELYVAAQKLEIESLQNLLYCTLYEKLTVKNVLDCLVLSEDCIPLKQLCFYVIYQNKEQFMGQDGVYQLKPKLIQEILNSITNQPKINKPSLENTTGLEEHLNSLYNSGKYSDVVLVSVDDQKFKTHRALLAFHSSFFRLMFTSKFSESLQQEIKLDSIDLDSKTVKYILDYIYTGKTESIEEISELMPLYQVTDVLMMSYLKSRIDNILIPKLSYMENETIIQILMFCKDQNIKGDLVDACWKKLLSQSNRQIIENLISIQLQQTKIIQDQQQQAKEITDLRNEVKELKAMIAKLTTQ